MMGQIRDVDFYLSGNEQWSKLDREWGVPVDLETEEDHRPQKLSPVLSTLDLRKSTFDSSFLMKKVRRKVGRQLSSTLDYKDFIQDLENEETKELPLKQFYFISGQILSALSVEVICDEIDDIFKSIEKLCSATSTIRHKKKKIPEVVHCSISATDLSFDDTNHKFDGDDERSEENEEREKSDTDDVDRYIDEAFNELNSTVENLASPEDMESRETVTTLVRKFSSVLKSPRIKRSPRRKRQCCDRFKELAEFWHKKAFESE